MGFRMVQSPASDRQFADESDDIAMPDFLDLAGGRVDAAFACSSSTAGGGIEVHTDRVEVIAGQDRQTLAATGITSWSAVFEDRECVVTIQHAQGVAIARVPIAFAASTCSALGSTLGRRDLQESLARRGTA